MVLLPISVPSCHWISTVPCLCCEAPIDSLPREQCPGSVLQEGLNGAASPSPSLRQSQAALNAEVGKMTVSSAHRHTLSPGRGLLVPHVSGFLREGHTASACSFGGLSPRH